MTFYMDKLVVRMDGWPGAPGFMTFYMDAAADGRPAVVDFVNAIKSGFHSSITFAIPAEGDVIEDADGTLSGSWTAGTEALIAGTSSQPFAAPAGVCINWTTGQVVGRRRLKGRTFLVPLSTDCYQANGTIVDAVLGSFRTAASGLWVGAGLRVWHRPTTPGGTDGVSHPVTGSNVADSVSVLRSRRA